MSKVKIGLSAVLSVLTYFMTFYVYNNTVKYILMVVTAVFLALGFSFESLKRHAKINIMVIIYLTAAIVFAVMNRHLIIERDVLLAAIAFSITFFEFLLALEYISDHGKTDTLVKIYFYLTLALVFIVDILAFIKGETKGLYLVGTKFSVVYLHFYLIAFYYLYSSTKPKKILLNKMDNIIKTVIVYALLFALTLITSIKVDCMTGVIGIVLLTLLLVLTNRFKKFFFNRITLICAMGLSFLFVWTYDYLLANPYIANFITNTLDTSLSISGRTEIYDALPKVMQGHWLIGYGYGSNYEVCKSQIGYADTQNALMNIIMDIGIIGAGLMILWMLHAFGKIKFYSHNVQNISVPLVALIYLFIFLGTIEITYNTMFLCILLILYAVKNDTALTKGKQNPTNDAKINAN